ncbi:MAG: CFI-box-CTERM domain-containing protein [Bdellovibrionia bacterium]
MPFKLQRASWSECDRSGAGVKKSRVLPQSGWGLRVFHLALFSFLFLNSSLAWAIIRLIPTNGGTIQTAMDSNTTFSSPQIYYYVQTGSTSPLPAENFLAQGVTSLDVTQTAASDAVNDHSNAIEVSFASTAAAPLISAGQSLVVMIHAGGASGTTSRPIPIATLNGVACSMTNCQAPDRTPDSNGFLTNPNNYFYAAKYSSGSTIRLGFYLNDICKSFSLGSAALNVCNGNTLSYPEATSSRTLPLYFSVRVATDPNLTPTSAAIDQFTVPIQFVFEVTPPSFTCPASSALNQAVFPGDGEVYFDTSAFQVGPVGNAQGAPGYRMIALGQRQGSGLDFDKTQFYGSNNLFAQTVNLNDTNASVQGLENSTSGDLKPYRISFIGQDRAGVFVQSDSSCVVEPVYAASIQGFLSKSNCFIATAAFRSVESSPVVMLREFRDRVLLPSSWGRKWVRSYYRWSPDAAAWLMEHRAFQYPVLLFLAPVEFGAWLILNPAAGGVFGLTLCAVFSIFVACLWQKERKGKG